MRKKDAAWLAPFHENAPIPWRCPHCSSVYRLAAGTMKKMETADSKEAHSELWWDSRHFDGRFSCLFQCSSCEAPCAIAGAYAVREIVEADAPIVDGEPEITFLEEFTPRFMSDPPAIIEIGENTPDAITEHVKAAFSLFWMDEESCANRIRSAVETLLTCLRVNRTRIDEKRKRKWLSLHTRIERFRKKYPTLADKLMAIKWIGNAGSHASGLKKTDLLDGFTLLQYVLEHLFERRAEVVARLSHEINRRRRPRSSQRRTA